MNTRLFLTGLPIIVLVCISSYAQSADAHYNPKQGRWLQRDPAGDIDGMNLYEYVSSRPSRFVDPSGRAKTKCRTVGSEWGGGWIKAYRILASDTVYTPDPFAPVSTAFGSSGYEKAWWTRSWRRRLLCYVKCKCVRRYSDWGEMLEITQSTAGPIDAGVFGMAWNFDSGIGKGLSLLGSLKQTPKWGSLSSDLATKIASQVPTSGALFTQWMTGTRNSALSPNTTQTPRSYLLGGGEVLKWPQYPDWAVHGRFRCPRGSGW